MVRRAVRSHPCTFYHTSHGVLAGEFGHRGLQRFPVQAPANRRFGSAKSHQYPNRVSISRPHTPGLIFGRGVPRFSGTPRCGAGENRTPVHQALNARATTIPDCLPDAGSPAGRLAVARKRRPANRLSESSSVFPDASCLSRCHPPLLLPGCGGSAPCAISGHDVSSLT